MLLLLIAYTWNAKKKAGRRPPRNLIIAAGIFVFLFLMLGGRNNNNGIRTSTLTSLHSFRTGSINNEFSSFTDEQGRVQHIAAEEVSGDMTISMKKGKVPEIMVVINNGEYNGRIVPLGNISYTNAVSDNDIYISFSLVYKAHFRPDRKLRHGDSRLSFTFFNTAGIIHMHVSLEEKIKEYIKRSLEHEISKQMEKLLPMDKPLMYASP